MLDQCRDQIGRQRRIPETSSVVERDASVMETTPRSVIDLVVRSVCGSEVERLVRLTGGGLNETYRVEAPNDMPVVVRIARQPVAWFTDEEHVMAQARGVGVPTPDVLGVEQVDHDGEVLSFSILRLVPGRSLDELAGELSASDLERLVMDSGELLARVHSVVPDRGIRHELESPDERLVARVVRVADQALGPAAAAVVERGAELLRDEVMTRPAPRLSLAHGDWLPKHLLIDDGGAIGGVIDWEFAGPASPAFDLAHWEVSAGDGLHNRSDLLRLGYARVADPDAADAGWVPAFAIDFALEVLGWRNPAPPARLRRCVDVIARHVGA
jgi:aminoglycoside phosphotransferase (APT) family kinase protein